MPSVMIVIGRTPAGTGVPGHGVSGSAAGVLPRGCFSCHPEHPLRIHGIKLLPG